MPIAAAVVTVSDRSARGERVDASGPLAVAALRAAGYTCHGATVVADGIESVEVALRQALASGSRVVVTTGGTGLARRDLTPEGTARVAERTLPGIAMVGLSVSGVSTSGPSVGQGDRVTPAPPTRPQGARQQSCQPSWAPSHPGDLVAVKAPTLGCRRREPWLT